MPHLYLPCPGCGRLEEATFSADCPCGRIGAHDAGVFTGGRTRPTVVCYKSTVIAWGSPEWDSPLLGLTHSSDTLAYVCRSRMRGTPQAYEITMPEKERWQIALLIYYKPYRNGNDEEKFSWIPGLFSDINQIPELHSYLN